MPEKETLQRAEEDAREGKSPSTQAGEFVREEIHHIREGKRGAESTKQVIAIGLSKARREGVKLAAPKPGKASSKVRKQAERDLEKGESSNRREPSGKRSRAISKMLKRKGRSAVSTASLSRQGRSSSARRGKTARKQAAQKAARTRAQHPRAA